MTFTITFLGSSGGPVDGLTCSILIKPSEISYKEILDSNLTNELLMIDAGSGITQLSEIIYNEMNNEEQNKLLQLYPNSLKLSEYFKVPRVKPFKDLQGNPFGICRKIFENIESYLITHPHLDHISALTINSASFCNHKPKNIYGSLPTINALKKHIFNGIIWPNLVQFNILKMISKQFYQSWNIHLFEIEMVDLSHGKLIKNENDQLEPMMHNDLTSNLDIDHYLSSAFLITLQQKSILIFGDFESDSMSHLDKNLKIWQKLSPLISNKSLLAIIMECSLSNNTSTNELYGHLMPHHLINELKNLESQVKKLSPDDKPLQNLNIIITHVKESNNNSDPRKEILYELEKSNDMGVKFSIAINGVSIEV
ncbi:cyclic-AMP phosphodiesterase [Hyphopichia burtonii NRRL Y-1933]|uniref:Cyclic-AMP phosphodiesterase n=1 Tax=Hyphopichia burtonii NRRL Y-1933 TaxID=984485 RepID=A0A1E4RRQ8_9ASCO|nr:cyclic-AMP phosphodiesterase [Hyphopichia burtonii NRRL Y-1933]ODV69952.1 cyclic-AMP phosphodiesterase [Hyphopichia burtonii NRRL Y-1933]